jgi:predicted DNA-binding transcriptional regulator YafY
MTGIPREERILNLLAALLASRLPVPFADIRRKIAGYDDDASVEAIEKRFDRDKADLRKLGVPLEYVTEDDFGRSGYLIPRDRFFLQEIRFTVEEGIALAAIERAAEATEGDPFLASLRSALAKITVDSPLSEASRESIAEQRLFDPHVSAGEPGPLSDLAGALAARRPIRFTYYTLGSGETALRTVEPYGVGYYGGNWYLVGRDVDKAEERVFRTTRIRGEVEVMDAGGYEIPDDFDLGDRIGHASWEMGREKPVEARIRFDPAFSFMIQENVRPGQRFAPDDDGGGVLTVRMTDPEALVRWVATFGPLAEILEPENLRERLVTHLEGLIRRYEP